MGWRIPAMSISTRSAVVTARKYPTGLGILRLAEYARALGYGRLTGIELPGEMPGLVP